MVAPRISTSRRSPFCSISPSSAGRTEFKLFTADHSHKDHLRIIRETETRDPCLRDRDKTEKFKILSETRLRRYSFGDARRDLEAPETLESFESFNVSPRRFPWSMVKHIKIYGLINSHHGKSFLFVILWVFAHYFDKYHWIINGLQHKELQL